MPPIVFGIMPLIGAILCILLPETAGCELPETLEDGENFGKWVKICSEIKISKSKNKMLIWSNYLFFSIIIYFRSEKNQEKFQKDDEAEIPMWIFSKLSVNSVTNTTRYFWNIFCTCRITYFKTMTESLEEKSN